MRPTQEALAAAILNERDTRKKVESLTAAIAKTQEEMQMRAEEIAIYQENLAEIRKAPIVSLNSFKENRQLFSKAQTALEHTQSNLKSYTKALESWSKSLKDRERDLASIKERADKLAPIIKFPTRDN